MEYVKKISSKLFGVDETVARTKSHSWCRITGVVESTFSGESTYGTYIGFLGVFECLVFDTGELYRGSKLFAPSILSGELSAQLANSKGSISSIGFAVDIGTRPIDFGLGYEYSLKPVIEISETDPLADLKKRLSKPVDSHEDVKESVKGGKRT